jgi:hypothetical protein
MQGLNIPAFLAGSLLENPAALEYDIFFRVCRKRICERPLQLQFPVSAVFPRPEFPQLDQVAQQGAIHRRKGQAQGIESNR